MSLLEPQALARPTISVAGTRLPAQHLISMFVEETLDGIGRCELTLYNSLTGRPDFLYSDRALLDFGAAVRVELGGQLLFAGRLTGLEGRFFLDRAAEIVVLAEDRLQDLRMTRRSRTFAAMPAGDVIGAIAREHGLSLEWAPPEAPAPPPAPAGPPEPPAFVQIDQSDLAFVRELARRAGWSLWLEDSTLHVADQRVPDAGVQISYPEPLWEFSGLADLAGQRTSLQVSGWDVETKQALAVTARPSVIARELGRGEEDGPSLLSRSLGDRATQLPTAMPWDEADAQAIADASFRRMARRFVSGAGLCRGEPGVRVGRFVDLVGLDPLFTGTYYVVEARHTFEARRGYRTQFRAERPGLGG